MNERKVFTLDPDYFPLKRMQEIIEYLHDHNQQYGERSSFALPLDIPNGGCPTVLMTDPAVASLPNSGYGAYDRGKEAKVWVKAENGSDFLGVVWPGKY